MNEIDVILMTNTCMILIRLLYQSHYNQDYGCELQIKINMYIIYICGPVKILKTDSL